MNLWNGKMNAKYETSRWNCGSLWPNDVALLHNSQVCQRPDAAVPKISPKNAAIAPKIQPATRFDDRAVAVKNDLLDRRGAKGWAQPVREIDVAERHRRHEETEAPEEGQPGHQLGGEDLAESDGVVPQVFGIDRDEQRDRHDEDDDESRA